MPIQNTDIVLYQAQDNTDNENGGGARTGTEVADGQVNNLFPDISRVDTVGGDVAMRKVFPVVNTNTREIYYGAHALIRKTPTDDNVSALLFHTDDPTDIRSEAQSDVEAYLVPSYEAPFYLFGNNVEGAKALTFLQRVEEAVPAVGDVYLLREGVNEQYVRIQDVNTEEVPYFYNNVDYTRRRLILTIDQPLSLEFTGSTFNPAGRLDNTCQTFATQQADAAKFYGTKDLSVDASIGDSSVTVDTIFEALVPATKQQLPLVNIQALNQTQVIMSDENSGDVLIGVLLGPSWTGYEVVELGVPVLPGSLTDGAIIDDGNGTLNYNNGDLIYSIDYTDGVLTYVSGTANINTNLSVKSSILIDSFIQYSKGIKVDLSNQGNVFVQNVAPVPTSLNCYIDYRSNGKWYRLVGNPDGTIGGQSGLGAAQINDNADGTATITMTLGAVPDLDSTVIVSWGSDDAFTKVSDEVITTPANESTTAAQAILVYPLANKNIDHSSVTATVRAFGASTVVVDFSTVSEGQYVTQNDIKFSLDHIEGIIYARLEGSRFTVGANATDDSESTYYIDVSYDYEDESTVQSSPAQTYEIANPVFNITSPGGNYDIGQSVSNVKLTLRFARRSFHTGNITQEFTVDVHASNGQLQDSPTINNLGIRPAATIYGTVNHSTGEIVISPPTYERNISSLEVLPDGSTATVYSTITAPAFELVSVDSLSYKTQAVSIFSQSTTERLFHYNTNGYVTLPPNIINDNFMIGLNGSLSNYARLEVTGSIVSRPSDGETVGSIDRNTGRIDFEYRKIKTFIPGFTGINDIVTSTVITDGNEGIKNIRTQVFKTASQDLVTSSLIVRYQTVNGSYIATTDSSGNFISGTDLDLVESYVDTTTGMVSMVFTADVLPDSIRYDAVAQTTLPLNPELLGLNPVRLPPDGRVPVFEAGRYVVVFDEAETSIATPVAGAVASASRTDLAYMEVVDVNGQRLAYDQFTADRAAGNVTFANPLSLIDRNGDALTGPYRIIDRVEDFVQCTDAAITGQVALSAPLTHDYLAGTAKVASALVWGDTGSRVYSLFSQQSFDVWDDSLTQSPTVAQYDNVNYPIQVVNADSFNGRWAIIFRSASTVDVVSEKLGVLIEDAPIASDIAPINPATGQPYFTIPAGGWGGGWVTSNVLRFNTESGDQNMWIIRSVQPGALTEETDDIQVEIRGDAN